MTTAPTTGDRQLEEPEAAVAIEPATDN